MAREDIIYYGQGEKIVLSGDFLQFYRFDSELKTWVFVDDAFVGDVYREWRARLVLNGKLEML